MNSTIDHLPGIDCTRIRTARIETQVLTHGPEDGEPVLFLHGNLASGTFWEETLLSLPEQFRAVAPDQRGYGQAERAGLIDATRGMGDWADDAIALANHFGWHDFHVVGHSLGGCVAWALLAQEPRRLRSVTLVAPGPPCGFPGAHALRGELNHPDGAGSGAGLVNPVFLQKLQEGDRGDVDRFFSPRTVMNRIYWKPPFRHAREEQLLSAMLQVHLGEQQFPGDFTASPHWPGFAPGRFGPTNALSPLYNQETLAHLLANPTKPRLLWVYGNDDAVISDASTSDPGQHGKLGLLRDWPGPEIFPPQPIESQVIFALDQYEQAGGSVRRLTLADTGHTPYLERPTEVHGALAEHLRAHQR
jgi:pimeloyl-ACP methyl ester carboxylesterase